MDALTHSIQKIKINNNTRNFAVKKVYINNFKIKFNANNFKDLKPKQVAYEKERHTNLLKLYRTSKQHPIVAFDNKEKNLKTLIKNNELLARGNYTHAKYTLNTKNKKINKDDYYYQYTKNFAIKKASIKIKKINPRGSRG